MAEWYIEVKDVTKADFAAFDRGLQDVRGATMFIVGPDQIAMGRVYGGQGYKGAEVAPATAEQLDADDQQTYTNPDGRQIKPSDHLAEMSTVHGRGCKAIQEGYLFDPKVCVDFEVLRRPGGEIAIYNEAVMWVLKRE